MAVEDYSLSLLSMKDFEESGVKIDAKWTGLEALIAVASLASKKLVEEKKIWKEQEKDPVIKSNWYSRPRDCEDFEHGNSSRSCDKGRSLVSEKAEKAVFPVNSGKRIDKKETELTKPVVYSGFDMYSKRKNRFRFADSKKLLGSAMKVSPRALKHDDEEGVADAECTKRKKKLKRSISIKGSKSNKRIKRERQIVLNETPDLPQDFKERIAMLNGSKIELVIQKCLFTTDVSVHHNRLSSPLNQILSKVFLNDDEKKDLDNGGQMSLRFIEPSLQECKLNLAKWAMPKEGKSNCSYSYVLRTQWRNVLDRNKLEKGDVIQLWSFRMPVDELCLALVLVRKASEIVEDGSQRNGSDCANDIQGKGESNGANDGSNDQSPTNVDMESTTTQVSTP